MPPLASTAAPPTDRDTFLRAVREADLLSASQYTKAKTLAPGGSAADIATALVAAGLLTRFQADRLLIGRTDGFALGPYVILDQIGRGAMSRVYKARHRTMNRPVAVKILAADLTRTAAAREAFQSEVRAAGKLTHPNIVTAYDANELHDRFYLVLEFVDGPSLDAFVRQRGPVPIAEACEFVRQIAAGLAHAHEKGMVHRDLKPQNVLVARPTPVAPLTAKIADFGLPKSIPAPEFASPEQLAGLPIDHRTDLYSLGRLFYFLLTGWVGPDEHPLPVVQLRPDVPPEVATIVHRLMARNPAGRFASAAELLVYLDAAFVPTALPVDDVLFDLPVYPAHSGHDSGFLGRAHPASGPVPVATPVGESAVSPWAQIAAEAAEETLPVNMDDTATPIPHKARPKSPRRGEPVPLWMIGMLLVGIVLLSLMGIGVIVKLLGK